MLPYYSIFRRTMASFLDSNTKLLEKLCEGDLIEFQRTFYSHFGIYIGGKKVIHVTDALSAAMEKVTNLIPFSRLACLTLCGQCGIIQCDDFWTVAGESNVTLYKKKESPYTGKKIVQRARQLVGTPYDFNVLTKNCEHFANWCRYGTESSEQADTFFSLMDKIAQPYNGLKNLSLRMMQACIQNGHMTKTPPEVDEKAVVRDIRGSSLCIRLSAYDGGFILGSKSLTFSACVFLAVIDLYKKTEISTFTSQTSLSPE